MVTVWEQVAAPGSLVALLVVEPVASVAEPPKESGPHAPTVV